MFPDIYTYFGVWAVLPTHCLLLCVFRPYFFLYKMEWLYNVTSEVSSNSDMLEFSDWNLQFLVNPVR